VTQPTEVRFRFTLLGLFCVGLAIGLVMVARSQVDGDQLHLLARGWRLAEQGVILPHGIRTSAGGNAPGSLQSLLIGVPLLLWRDYRAPALVILLAHAAAWLLLDRLLAAAAGRRERVLFAILFWLNPWQLYFGAHVWSPNWLVPFGALHAVTAWQLRERPALWASAGHVVVLGLVFQVHPSFVVLVLATVLLLATRRIRAHWGGALLGAALVVLSLLPWLRAIRDDPTLLPGKTGFVGHGLVTVLPVVRGVAYLLRYASLSFSDRMTPFDFTATLGADVDAVLAPTLRTAVWLVGVASLVVPIAAHRRLWPRLVRRWRRRPSRPASRRAWLSDYAGTVLVAALASFALSPTTVMAWQGFAAFHAAVLPVVLVAALWLRSRRRALARRLAGAWVVGAVVVATAMAFGAPLYRRGGRAPHTIVLRADHPMLHDLGIDRAGSVTIDPVNGWWPDALPLPTPLPDRR
jgi:hypothetical protein